MKYALLELKSIGMFDPYVREQIDKWIDKHINQMHIKIQIHHPEHIEEQEYRIKDAKRQLGTLLAENSNMYPTFEPTENGFECMMSTLYFKNEFGK